MIREGVKANKNEKKIMFFSENESRDLKEYLIKELVKMYQKPNKAATATLPFCQTMSWLS
jgi:hypothetical protein